MSGILSPVLVKGGISRKWVVFSEDFLRVFWWRNESNISPNRARSPLVYPGCPIIRIPIFFVNIILSQFENSIIISLECDSNSGKMMNSLRYGGGSKQNLKMNSIWKMYKYLWSPRHRADSVFQVAWRSNMKCGAFWTFGVCCNPCADLNNWLQNTENRKWCGNFEERLL